MKLRGRPQHLRCPYCHDGIEVAASGWMACAVCLARHHAECWVESPRCGSCGQAEGLFRRGPAVSAPASRDEQRAALAFRKLFASAPYSPSGMTPVDWAFLGGLLVILVTSWALWGPPLL